MRDRLDECPSCGMNAKDAPQLNFKWRFCKICGWNVIGMDPLVLLEEIS